MKERPILFSGPMVRAILDGRKTITRRVVKDTGLYAIDAAIHGADVARKELVRMATQCPYGEPGDRLWVREAWHFGTKGKTSGGGHHAIIAYAENPKTTLVHISDDEFQRCRFKDAPENTPWTNQRKIPSIHMPRWASRITLEITAVRVERLQDISEEDAKAEGVEEIGGGFYRVYHHEPEYPDQRACLLASISFRQLWKSINGEESWEANPWVWVVEFERIKP